MSLSPRSVALVVQLTWLDFLRRKDLYVVAILMSLFVVATFVVRLVGVDSPATASFLMSAGLNLSHLAGAFLAATFCARCFPEEFERGTLTPLLAKPVRRMEVLLGKLAGALSLALGAFGVFVLLTILATPPVPGQNLWTLLEVTGLLAVGLVLLGTLATTLSFWTPTVVAAFAALLWHFGAGAALNLLLRMPPHFDPAWKERALGLLPDPTMLFHIEAYAEGGALPLAAVLGWAAYGALWALAVGLLASARFRRAAL